MKSRRLRNEKNIATVVNIIEVWKKGGIKQVHKYLNDKNVKLYDYSWGSKLKQLLKDSHWTSVNEEIKFVSENLDISNKIKKDGKEK